MIDTEHTPTPQTGDLLRLSNLVQEAGALDDDIKDLERKVKNKKELRRQLLEVVIPDLMQEMGGEGADLSKLQLGAFTVELKKQTFAGIPSPSSIAKERDEDVRDEMIMRRSAALALLEEKAPALLKRSYEIEFDRDSEDEAEEFETQLKRLENPPEFIRGLTIHPATLAKWINECDLEGKNITAEERKILGVMSRNVAKISR